jgi:hypothetical protein
VTRFRVLIQLLLTPSLYPGITTAQPTRKMFSSTDVEGEPTIVGEPLHYIMSFGGSGVHWRDLGERHAFLFCAKVEPGAQHLASHGFDPDEVFLLRGALTRRNAYLSSRRASGWVMRMQRWIRARDGHRATQAWPSRTARSGTTNA